MLICIEALTVSAFVLIVFTLVAGRYLNFLQGSPMLTFDTSSVKIHLANQGISNLDNVQDWYEPHYLSVSKGMWQYGAARLKNESSTICTAMHAGYTFSLPKLLAADAGLPGDSPLLSSWSFAVLKTEMPYVCLTIALTFNNWAMIHYLFVIIFTKGRLTAESPLQWVKVGYITSILALITMVLSSAKVTAMTHRILQDKSVVENGVAWSTGGFYALTWSATGLIFIFLTLSVVLAFMLRQPTRSPRRELDRKGSGHSDNQ